MGKWFQDKSFSTGKREKGIKARKVYRALGILLAATLVFQTVPFEGISVSASESSGGGLCEHHRSHTPDCGCKEAEPGHACVHEHTEDCYRTVEGEEGSTTKELDCHHEHDEECGYREAAEGSPCTFVCEICKGGTDETPQDKTDGNGINEGDSENPGTENGDEVKEPDDGQEECICEERCTEDNGNGGCRINTDCPVCGVEGANLSDCRGKDAEDSTEDAEENTDQQEDTGLCKHHQEHDDACGYLPESEDSEGSPCTYECRICPVEELIAALSDKVTPENADDVRGQLEEILALFSELTGDEQEQIDLSRCYELQEALDGANDPNPITESVEYQEASWNGGKVTYESKTETCTLVENSAEAIEWTAGWYAVSGSVTISEPITVNGEVHLILTNGCTLTAEKGIVVTSTNSLTIYAQTNGTGTLTATGTVDGNNASAGIGGSTASLDSGTITIHGGVINATGGGISRGNSGAGIGGGGRSSGNGGNSGTITIFGGVITSSSDVMDYITEGTYLGGAGIGGGGSSSGNGGTANSITIYGGDVTATSKGTQGGGAGIGGGAGAYNGGSGNITICGGTVRATGGCMDTGLGGAGIGGGGGGMSQQSGNGTVTISDGTVTAVGGNYAAGIGGGSGYKGSYGANITGGTGNVSIIGGIVDAKGGAGNDEGDYAGAPIGNGGNATATATVNKTTGIVFENGVGTVCGDVTFNGSYAVPAGYSLHIPVNASLSGSGTLSGGGRFTTENLTEDMISVPTDLYYNGQDRTEEIAEKVAISGGITLCGTIFTVSGWTVAVEKTGDLTYTATYTNESDNTKNFTKTITLQQSGTDLTSDGKVLTYNGDTQTATFTADDTITVKATPTATGQAPTKAAARLRGDPTAGQMVVFVGGTQVSAPADVGEDGAYTMTVSAADVLFAAGGPGKEIPLTAKFVGNDNMADGAGTVDVSISAAAKIENGSFTTYVGESGLDAAFEDSGNSGAIFTLLANVTRAKVLIIKIDCDLDLGGYTITGTGDTAVGTLGSKNVTIRGTGEIISTNGTALEVWGNVTLAGGCFRNTGSNAAVSISYQGSLSVTDGNVTIQNTGGGYGLAVKNAQSQSVRLSAGTYSGTAGAISIVEGSLILGGLLANSGDTRYAYFDESGTTPFTGVLGNKSLAGPVTVQRCEHDKSVCEYTPNEDADTHAMTCRACGLEGAVEDCQLTYTSNETQHTAACETCGRSRTEAHSYGSWEPQHNGTAVTIRRVCESCKYTKTDGTFTVLAPGQTMQYGKPITLTCSSTLPDAAFQWLLKSSADMSNVQKSIGASFTPSETLAVGEYCWDARVNWTGGNTIAKSGYLSVLPAPLSNVNVTLSPASAVYDGTEQKPTVTIAGLTEGTDYSVSYTGDFTSAGTHTVTVTGKGNYEGTVTKTFTIEKAEQTDFAFAAVTKPYEKNGTFTLSTTGGGGNGAVLYRVPENNGVLMVNGDQATIIGVGTVTVTATKAESDNYKAATATGKITITKAPAPTITYPAAGGIAYGQELSDSVLTGGSTEYGTFAWENGSIIPTVDNTGYTVVFTASEETEKNYETITDTTQKVPVKVEQAVPAVSVTAAVFGSKDNRRAVLSASAAKAGAGAFPTGTVAFMDCTGSTEVEIGTATLSKGSASYTWDGLQDKTYTIKAVYKGNNNYREAESRELTFDAAKQNQQDFSLDAIGAKTYGDAAISLKTIGGSGSGAVRYESSDEDVIRIEDGRAVIVGAGTATITAIKEGDKIYNEASASRNVTVAKKALTVRADNRTVVRGKPMPAFTYRADGLVNGDTFTTAPSITAGVQDTDTLGKYDIVINGGTLQNSESYHITYVNGTLNIVERFYTVTVTDGTGGGEYAEGGHRDGHGK